MTGQSLLTTSGVHNHDSCPITNALLPLTHQYLGRILIPCRHPEAQARPVFKDILLELVGKEDTVFKIPEEDSATHKLASLVGGPLEAGEKMYTDLQWKYFTTDDYEQQI